MSAAHPLSRALGRRCLRRSLGPGLPAAPEKLRLALLPPGPDAVRRLSVRGTWPSTFTCASPTVQPPPREGIQPRWSGLRVQGTASSPPSAADPRRVPPARRKAGTDPVQWRSERGALPEVPAADVRRGGRSGGRGPDAPQRDRARPGAPGLPLRRPARHREDVDGAHPRQGAQLRLRPDGHTRRDVQRVRVDRGRDVARRGRDGCGEPARDRRHPRDPRTRRPPAGRGAVQGLHPRRGAPAHGRRVQRAPQADRGAAAAPRLHLLHDRPLEDDPDRPVALSDLHVLAAATAGADEAPPPDRRRRGDRGARRGALPGRPQRPRQLPRRRLDARPARRRHLGGGHACRLCSSCSARSRRRRSSGSAT